MRRKSWWYEVSRDEYEESKTSYGSNIYAIDPRLQKNTGSPSSKAHLITTQSHKAFAQGKIFVKPAGKSQTAPSSGTLSTVDKKHRIKGAAKPTFHFGKECKTTNKQVSKGNKSREQSIPLEQRQFVHKKIMTLGSLDAVKNFFSSDDAVSKYAKSIAQIILSAERIKKKPHGAEADLMKSVDDELTYAIKRRIARLKTIIQSSGELTMKKISFDKTLEELRHIFRASRSSFSASDIQEIQRLKDEFENALAAAPQ